MHAVLARLAPEARVVDLAHDCPAGNVEAAAHLLRGSWSLFPDGTIHVTVVDPGVGTSRAVLAARAHGHAFIAPDNGTLGGLVEGGEVRQVVHRDVMAREVAPTFHGRDVMAPVAARLALGMPLAHVGPHAVPIRLPTGLSRDPGGITGRVMFADSFGNLVTNLSREVVGELGRPADEVRVRLGDAFLDGLVRTFADVAPGRALAYFGSGGHLELAVNNGRAIDLLGLAPGDPVRVERSPA
jgi:S-adenosylmethionine hydrolase